MKNFIFIFTFFFSSLILFSSCKKDEDKTKVEEVIPPYKTNTDTKVWAHFMVWFETPETTGTGKWGQHWANFGMNPRFDEASQSWISLNTRCAPLTGPYASRDTSILEYQFLLMKYSGIDGVLVDWYGIDDLGTDENKTLGMSKALAKAKEIGLELGVVYEDRFKAGFPTPTTMTSALLDNAVANAKVDMDYLQQNYFTDDNYIKINGSPLLLVFGPEVINKFNPAVRWSNVFSDLPIKPYFFPLIAKISTFRINATVSGVAYRNAVGEYMWPNNDIYQNQYTVLSDDSIYIAGAWPGFNDSYNGVSNPPKLGFIDYRNGDEIQEQLNYAKEKKPKYLQIATWNDYGESTMIEPTYQFGYTFLEKIQSFTGVRYMKSDLENIKRYYDLKVANKDNAAVQIKLKEAYHYFIKLQPDKAVEILNQIGS